MLRYHYLYAVYGKLSWQYCTRSHGTIQNDFRLISIAKLSLIIYFKLYIFTSLSQNCNTSLRNTDSLLHDKVFMVIDASFCGKVKVYLINHFNPSPSLPGSSPSPLVSKTPDDTDNECPVLELIVPLFYRYIMYNL